MNFTVYLCNANFIYSYKNIWFICKITKLHNLYFHYSYIHFFFVLTRSMEVMHNPKQLFIFHFLTFAHSINTILSLCMTRGGLRIKKQTMGCPIFWFLVVIVFRKMVGYFMKGTRIRKNMLEFLGGLTFLDCTAFCYIQNIFLFDWKMWFLRVVSTPTYSAVGLTSLPCTYIECQWSSSHPFRVHQNFVILSTVKTTCNWGTRKWLLSYIIKG